MKMRIVCMTDSKRMHLTKMGVPVVEMNGDCEPFNVWRADAYRCRECGAEVLSGFSTRPVSLWDAGFAHEVAMAEANPDTVRMP